MYSRKLALFIVVSVGLLYLTGCQEDEDSKDQVSASDFSEIDVSTYESTGLADNLGVYKVEKMTLLQSPLYNAELAEVIQVEEAPSADYYFEIAADKLISYTANLGGTGYGTVLVAEFEIDNSDVYEKIIENGEMSVATRMELFQTSDGIVLLSTSATATGDEFNDTFMGALYFLESNVNPWPPAEWPEDVVYEDIGYM